MADRTWADFRAVMFGTPYMVWHDGADFDSIVAEWQRDPAEVEAMLRLGLAEGDSLAADTIRHLPLDDAARERLVVSLQGAPSGSAMDVEVGQSLARLTGDESHAATVAAVLTGNGHWGDKLDAAIALRGFTPTEALIATLEVGLLDEEYLVRYHSANTLLSYGGVAEPDIASAGADFDVVVRGTAEQLAELRDRLGGAARAHLA